MSPVDLRELCCRFVEQERIGLRVSGSVSEAEVRKSQSVAEQTQGPGKIDTHMRYGVRDYVVDEQKRLRDPTLGMASPKEKRWKRAMLEHVKVDGHSDGIGRSRNGLNRERETRRQR